MSYINHSLYQHCNVKCITTEVNAMPVIEVTSIHTPKGLQRLFMAGIRRILWKHTIKAEHHVACILF